jgi:hypothetical protein
MLINREFMSQLAIFDEVTTARNLRDEAIGRAIDHANVVEPKWAKRAWELFEFYCSTLTAFSKSTSDEEFKTEHFVQYALGHGLPKPPDNRAFGAITLKAVKSGLITRVRYEAKDDPKSHGQPISVWRVKC